MRFHEAHPMSDTIETPDPTTTHEATRVGRPDAPEVTP